MPSDDFLVLLISPDSLTFSSVPVPLMRRLLKAPGTAVTRARTADNAAFLAEGFLTAVVGRYEGTALGRQELDGEMVEDRTDALWSRILTLPCSTSLTDEDQDRVIAAVRQLFADA